jgi:hypothetical protein
MVVRRVKGTLFVDYVRMMRGHKDAQWIKHLRPDDMVFLSQRIEPEAWYPMETFERMGLAILAEIAKGELSLSRLWGKAQVEWVNVQNPGLVALGDPCDTLMRFRVLRNSFFDYPALEIRAISDGEAAVEMGYGMCPTAEHAASLQTMGFFERLLELAGAKSVTAWFSTQSWTRDPVTTLQLRWTT